MYLLLPIILHHCCRNLCTIVANYSVFLISIFPALLFTDYKNTLDSQNKHIEHRVAGANADHWSVITVILLGIYYGIENKSTLNYEKVYGNVFNDAYELPKLPTSLAEAQYLHKNSKIILPLLEHLKICQN